MRGVEPYVGLRPYDIGDQNLFHGRGRESRDVSVLWQANRLLVLYGPSGVGKTSLVQAGVISRFTQETAEVLPVGRVSHSPAFHTANMPERNPYTFALLSSWSLPDDSRTPLVGLSITKFLSQHVIQRARPDRYGDPLPVLGVIDQFEELFSDFPHQQRYVDQFIDHLADAVEKVPSLRLLISIREESLAKLIPRETKLAGHFRARFRVLPLTRDAAQEAVTGPLSGTRRSFAPGVAEKLVDNLLTTEITGHRGETTKVAMDSVEPVHLQVVCTALWRALPDDVTTITEQYLHHHGGARTVAELCARMVTEVADEHRIPEGNLYEWLEWAFITKLGSRGTICEGVSETGGMPNQIARALEERGILGSKHRSGLRWYELQHDRLIEPIRQFNGPRLEGTVPDTSPADYLRTAQILLANGELELAQKHAEEALRVCGEDDLMTRAEAESFLGDIAVQRDWLSEAESHYRRAAEQFETLQEKAAVGRLLAAIGRLLLAKRPYADAVDALQAAVTRLPGDVTVQVELARALWFSGDLRAAAAVSGGVLTIAPDSAEARAGRGQIRVELNDDVSALEDLDNLPRLQPNDVGRRADVRAARALALARLGRLEEAVTEADAAEMDAPDSGPVLLRASEVARTADEPTQAYNLLRRARDAQNPALRPHQRDDVQRLLAEPPEGESGS